MLSLMLSLAGFPVIGLVGMLGDIAGALACSCAMPNLARRLWLVSRNSHVRKNKDGRYTLEGLLGADKIDVGNYKKGDGYIYSTFANCAAEFGEVDLVRDLLEKLEGGKHPTVPSPTGHGAVMTKDLSMLGCTNIFKARTMKQGDWAELINSERDEVALAAPKLDSVPFPLAMVARCHAEGADGLSFVLRGPAQPTDVTLGFKDLKTGESYQLLVVGENRGKEEVAKGIRADKDGTAKVRVPVGNRSEFELRLQA
jgi:hypothetical protein